MCKYCQKLMEIFAETQLKYGEQIKKVMISNCSYCKDAIYIVAKIEKKQLRRMIWQKD